jgi:hypothetical protein
MGIRVTAEDAIAQAVHVGIMRGENPRTVARVVLTWLGEQGFEVQRVPVGATDEQQ